MSNTITVGLGEMAISADPGDVMIAFGLGSCLGIGAFDPVNKIAGLLHAVLPTHRKGDGNMDLKYVDTGIPALINEMVNEGAKRANIYLRMAGGANMLNNTNFADAFKIGVNNVISAHETIKRMNLRLTNQAVGGNSGRTVRLYIGTGRMTVRVIGGIEQDL